MGGLTIGRDIPNNEGNKTKSIYPALCESKSVRNDRVKGFGNEVLSWPLPGGGAKLGVDCIVHASLAYKCATFTKSIQALVT